MEEEVPSGGDNIVTEFNSYEDFLDSQITSLDLYYLDYGQYPEEDPDVGFFETSSAPGFMTYLSEYLAKTPLDPVNTGNMQYYYTRLSPFVFGCIGLTNVKLYSLHFK